MSLKLQYGNYWVVFIAALTSSSNRYNFDTNDPLEPERWGLHPTQHLYSNNKTRCLFTADSASSAAFRSHGTIPLRQAGWLKSEQGSLSETVSGNHWSMNATHNFTCDNTQVVGTIGHWRSMVSNSTLLRCHSNGVQYRIPHTFVPTLTEHTESYISLLPCHTNKVVYTSIFVSHADGVQYLKLHSFVAT